MKEIKLKNNTLNLKVFIDDFPNLCLIPDSELDLLITDLELEVSAYFEKKIKRKNKKEAKNLPP